LSDWKSGFVKLETVRGWLFDVYPSGFNEMTVWVIAENGDRVRLVDRFTHRIYVSGKLSDLKSLAEKVRGSRSVAGLRFVEKYANFMEASKRQVLEIDVNGYRRTSSLARRILRRGGYEKFRLYNVDVPVSQTYLYERDAFPLAYVVVVDNGKNLCFDVLDSVESLDYRIPPLRSMWLNIDIKKENVPQRLNDELDSISLESGGETVLISEGDERGKILDLVKTVEEEDPAIFQKFAVSPHHSELPYCPLPFHSVSH